MTRILKHQYILLCFIFLIGLFLRVYQLNSFPVGLHGDEASIGYNAYSLLKTASDQEGHFLPLTFDQFGNFRAAGYQYVDIPFVEFMGLNALSVRLPAALFGSLTVIVLYFFAKELFENRQIALLGAFLLAILPWHINLSRASSEGIISTFFVVLGIFFLYKGIKQQEIILNLFILGCISLLISIFFYHASAFFVPVFLPFLFLFTNLEFQSRKKIIILLVTYFCILIGVVLFLTIGGGSGRASQVSLLSVPGGTKEVTHAADEEGTQNPFLTRFYHNKFYFYGRLFLTTYSEHFSGDYLFINNGNPIRYKLLWTGNLYLVEAPFLIIGFSILLSDGLKRKKYHWFIPIFWLLLGAIPAALTWEDLPNVVRSNLMIPGLTIIIAFGFYEIMQLTRGYIKIILVAASTILLLQNIALFSHYYFYSSKIHEPWYRSAGESDLIYSLQKLSKGYKYIVMTTQNNNNFIFYLFYNAFDPATFQKMGSPREKDGLHFKNLIYSYSICPIDGATNPVADNYDTLFVDDSKCVLPKNAEIIHTVRTPDGLPVFNFIKINKS